MGYNQYYFFKYDPILQNALENVGFNKLEKTPFVKQGHISKNFQFRHAIS